MRVTDEDEGKCARGVRKGHKEPFAGGGGFAGERPVGFQAVGEEVERAVHGGIEFVVPICGQPDGVFQLGEDPDHEARRRRDVALLLAGHAEREFVAHFFSVAGDLPFERGELFKEVWHW